MLLGSYTVVEKGNIGYSAAIDSYANTLVKARNDNKVSILAPQLGLSSNGKLLQDGRLDMTLPKELDLLKICIEIAASYALGSGAHIGGLTIETRTDGAFGYTSARDGSVVKSGLGSSAAIAVATIDSVMKLYGMGTCENEALHKLSQLAHNLASGKIGSGFDVATAVYGSIVYSRYSPDIIDSFPKDYTSDDVTKIVRSKWDYTVEPLQMPRLFWLSFAKIVGGGAVTSSIVHKINYEFKSKEPEKFAGMVKEINHSNEMALDALKKIGSGSAETYLPRFKEEFERARLLTKALAVESNAEVEPDEYTKCIEESNDNGAFVTKLPGAGGRDAIVALSLSRQDKRRLDDFWNSRDDLKILPINFKY